MKKRIETEERDKKIASFIDYGYTKNEVYNMGFSNLSGKPLSKRYIQRCITKYSKVEYKGKITDSKIFRLRDVENILNNPQKKDEIVKKRVMDHYKKQNEKFLNIEPKTKLQEQAKLRATVFKRDNYECVECKSSLGLQCSCNVYKKEYDSFDDEVDSYKTLCYECVRREKEL